MGALKTRRALLWARVIAWAEDNGKLRGLRGSSGTWLGVWVLMTGYRYIKKLAAEEPIVVRESLAPGEQLVITHFASGDEPEAEPTPSRRRRRKDQRADR